MAAPAAELAFASATSRATEIGASGLPPLCPVIRLRMYRPMTASAIASPASAGTAVIGSNGRPAKVLLGASPATMAQTAKRPASVPGLVICTAASLPGPPRLAAAASGQAGGARRLRHRRQAGPPPARSRARWRRAELPARESARRLAGAPAGAAASGQDLS